MARPIVLTKALAVADPAAVAVAQALGGAGNLVINGTAAAGGVATLDSQRRISILSSGNDSALTWTVYGTNEEGVALSETVAGGNAVAVVTLQDFLTVTRIRGSGATAGTVEVGTNTTGSTRWVVPNRHLPTMNIGVEVEFPSGAATATVEITDDDPLAPISLVANPLVPPICTPLAWTALSNLNVLTAGVINQPVSGYRLTITAGTGQVKATFVEAGIAVF